MNKVLYIATLFLLLTSLAFAQEQETISITFSNESLESSLSKIETKTGLNFYYQEDWISNYSDLKINKSYSNKTLDFILEDVLIETNLNFFITDGKIILSQNIRIHNDLANNFFGLEEDNVLNDTTNNIAPIFYKEYSDGTLDADSLDLLTQEKKKAIVKDRIVTQNELKFIGKETEKNAERFFTLKGVIKNNKTGEPIPNVAVRTKDNKYSAVSNIDGRYSIKLPVGLNSLELSSIGFNFVEQQIIMYNDGTVNFDLVESVTELGEVVVSSKQNQIIKETVTGVTSIDVKSIKTIPMVLGERDIIKAAVTMPGIKTVGEGAQGFNVRGGKSDQNLVLLDNAVVYNPFHFFGFFSAINPYTIGSANIYKGSIPIEYGGRLSSVFDIKTKDGDIDKFEGEAGIGPVTSNVKISTPIIKDKSSLMVGARATYSGWILRSLDEEDLKNSDANFYDLLVNYTHKFNEKNTVKATGYYSRDKFNLSPDSLYTYSNSLASVEWKHIFTDKHNLTTHLSNSQYKYSIDYENNPGSNFDYGFDINETQLKLVFNYYLNKQHDLKYGVSSKLYNLNPGYLDPTDGTSQLESINVDKEKALESAIFVGDEFKLSDKISLNAGLRYTVFNAIGPASQFTYEDGLPKNESTALEELQYDNGDFYKTYSGLEYRISGRYSFTDDFSIKAGFDTNYQYIHLLSTNTTQSPTDTWKLSDLNIEPQKGQQVSVGLFKNFKNEMYQLSLEGYYKRMDNVLDYKVGAEMLLNETIEREIIPAKGKAYGVEFLLKKTKGDFTGWLGYTYSRAYLRTDSQFNDEMVNNNDYYPANFDKPHDVSIVANYKLTKRYSFSANFVYQTGRPITYPVGSYQYGNSEYTLYSDRNQFRIPDYYRLDIGVNIEGNHKIKKFAHSFWNFSIYNVLGRNNPYSIYFVTEDGEVKAYKTSIFSIPVPTLTYNFKF
ncbi:TonB-dependent receptor [Neptunitalea lumnitzerae]|uniref:TonB-dependent receptor n=1 Tax=Neptunitalea lumnitzerae TaxID=2965509 RepID=A0ABQ5MN58_9FLAO|nr:TonB-dependent receptor [Neptunitalea sp. Y10]GLB50555.1 TonB-dependent receptor [Neptunitalea sp. Y10]